MSLERRRLSYQQPIQSKQKEVFVFSQEELIAEIGSLVIETNTFPGLSRGAFPGKIIKIGKPFTVTKTIEIQPEAIGLTIDGCGSCLLPDVTDSFDLFVIKAPLCTIKNIYVGFSSEGTAPTRFRSFAKLAGDCYNVRIENNYYQSFSSAGTNRFLEVTDDGYKVGMMVTNNYVYGNRSDWINFVNVDSSIISNNFFNTLAGGTLASITLGAGCLGNVISGNARARIDTSASSGFDAIVGNSLGAVVAAGTDSNVGNT